MHGAVMDPESKQKRAKARERVTRRVRAYFAAVEKKGLPIEAAVQDLVRIVGCGRDTVYRWKQPKGDLVSNAYCDAVEKAINELEKSSKSGR